MKFNFFRAFDAEGCGFIAADEMRQILSFLPHSLEDREMDEMLRSDINLPKISKQIKKKYLLRNGDQNGLGFFDVEDFG